MYDSLEELKMAAETKHSRLFAVKTTGGQEKTVAGFISTRIALTEKPVYSVVVLDTLKGYVFVEADNAHIVGESIAGFKHIKSQIPGMIQLSDIEKFLVTRSILSELRKDDIVEVVAGPFKGMRAKITRVEKEKSDYFRDERAFTSVVARTQLARAEALFDGGQFTDHPKAGFILDSYKWARKFAELSESIWDELLSSTPLNREKTKTIIESALSNNPLQPLRCLD